MSTALVSDRLQDLAGPIVVKEVRQGLRGRVFAVFFTLLLIASVVVALYNVERAARYDAVGIKALFANLVVLGAVCFFIIPYQAFRSMAREREDETWVLLALTGLGPRRIVRGKFISAVSQAVLFASASAPFIVFAYFLNGISVLQVVAALVLSAGWSALLVAVAIALATQAQSRLGRAATHFIALGLFGGATLLAFAFSEELARHDKTGTWQFWGGVGGFVCLGALATVLVLESAAAGLSLSTEAASRGPRQALVALTVGGWCVSALLCMADDSLSSDTEAAGSVMTCFVLALCGGFAAAERDGWPRACSTMRGWLKPGALRSWLLVVVLLLANLAFWVVVRLAHRTFSFDRYGCTVFAAPLYVLLYMSAAAVAGRVSPLRRFEEPVATRTAFAIVVALGVLVPPFVAVLFRERAESFELNVFNPIIGLINFLDRSRSIAGPALVVLFIVTLLSVLTGGAVLASRDRERA